MKQPRILSVSITGVPLFEDGIFRVDFNNKQRVYAEKNSDNMSHLFSSVYVPRIISFVGINASGKSTTLNLLSWVMGIYFNNESMNDTRIDIEKLFNNEISISIFFVIDATIFNIVSEVEFDEESRNLYFINETVYSRDVNSYVTSANLFERSQYDFVYSRQILSDLESTFLEADKSIAKKYIPKENASLITDLCYLNEAKLNIINYDIVDPSVYKFLDSSIEYILTDENEENKEQKFYKKLVRVKFLGKEEMILSQKELDSVLSSGTRKGIKVLTRMKTIFERGGYIFIDEIENHFNKSIVLDIFKLFRSDAVNPKAATLVFSTHYTELIDDFDRNDMINITTKSKSEAQVKILNLAETLKRSDYKKSDIYFSDLYNIGTSTNYSSYLSLLDYFSQKPKSDSEAIVVVPFEDRGKNNA